MRQIINAALFALTLAGCTTTGQHDDHDDNVVPTEANQQQMAVDAVQQLATLYPPAKTRFELHQTTPDAFGLALANTLRERGYALLEISPDDQAKASEAKAPAEATTALPLRYVLDQADDSNLYRLILLIGNQSITRPYLEENGSFEPAGYWVRKE